jgi:GH25 family lysozyme M1 (1,4-beta-N-acetylmuramidase)
MLYGIDVSANQGEIDWDLVAATNRVAFVYARAIHVRPQTPSGEDERFVRNHDGCERLAIPFGAYLFYIPQEEAVSQVDRFLTFAEGRYGQLSPMIDVEDNVSQQWGSSIEERLEHLQACIDRIESILGSPIIYTNQSTWSTHFDGTSAFSKYKLWVADYPQQSGKPKNIPAGWPGWTMHQYASDRSFVSGIGDSVDLNCLNADSLLPIRQR